MVFDFKTLETMISDLKPQRRYGHVTAIGPGSIEVEGLTSVARIGEMVSILRSNDSPVPGEIISMSYKSVQVMPFGQSTGTALGDLVRLDEMSPIAPDDSWMGRIVDAFGAPLDGEPLARGSVPMPLQAPALPAAERRALGDRMPTGLAAFDTLLPLAQGQRIGIFAGSGVGKSSLLADLAKTACADVVVLGLIGERGRELRHFTDHVLGKAGLARSVVVAATSDQSPLAKRRAAWTAMAVAEYFRDQGKQVLLLLDSITRFAEAHREIALTAGEAASLRAFPPSTSNLLASLSERAGPGLEGMGDITAVMTVLVAGSDMDEPVADSTRGLLDGHVVLDREIAERGRFPAIDVRRSVSRSLPDIATKEENELILRARKVLGVYEASAPMIQTGLYVPGSDAEIDRAILVWPPLDAFFSRPVPEGPKAAFEELARILEAPDTSDT